MIGGLLDSEMIVSGLKWTGHIYIYKYLYIYIYKYIYIYIYMHMYMYIYIYICKHIELIGGVQDSKIIVNGLIWLSIYTYAYTNHVYIISNINIYIYIYINTVYI